MRLWDAEVSMGRTSASLLQSPVVARGNVRFSPPSGNRIRQTRHKQPKTPRPRAPATCPRQIKFPISNSHSPGGGVECGFEANENRCQTEKTRSCTRHGKTVYEGHFLCRRNYRRADGQHAVEKTKAPATKRRVVCGQKRVSAITYGPA